MTDELPLATSDWRDHCAGFREAYAEKLRAKQEEDIVRNSEALEFAIKVLRHFRMEYAPGLHMYEVIYGNWKEDAANKYAEYTEAIERLENLLKGE